jgi:hypothetical protein
MDKFLKFIGTIVFSMGSTLLSGVFISHLWLWFMVPLGLMEIGVIHACGIALLISYTTYQLPMNIENGEAEKADTIKRLLILNTVNASIFFTGYVIQFFL